MIAIIMIASFLLAFYRYRSSYEMWPVTLSESLSLPYLVNITEAGRITFIVVLYL